MHLVTSDMIHKLFLFAALLIVFPALAHDDVRVLLKQADAYRLPAAAARVEVSVESYRNEALNKERRYTVYIKPGRRSLLLMRSPMEIGQKILMLGDQFWLLMPDSQRPLRITASQRLLGEASTGDVSSMVWSEDYSGEMAGEVTCPSPPVGLPGIELPNKARSCLHLNLSAAHPGVNYSHVDLFLDKASKMPVKADLFVISGKQAKEAWYEPKMANGQLRIMGMALLDQIQVSQYTVVRYLNMVAKDMPEEFFNPASLIRNSLAGW
jgi:hypothetical protein